MQEYYGWKNIDKINSRKYTCGHCGNSISSDMAYYHADSEIRIYICHSCGKPTFFNRGEQIPGALVGDDVSDVSEETVLKLYNETRRCMTCNAFTGAVLCARKLLMNIAVAKGANAGLRFIEYVEFLSANNYVPPDGKEWVDHIRKKGNEATHEIVIMSKEEAEDLIIFIEMLLKFIYEFPAKIKKKNASKP